MLLHFYMLRIFDVKAEKGDLVTGGCCVVQNMAWPWHGWGFIAVSLAFNTPGAGLKKQV